VAILWLSACSTTEPPPGLPDLEIVVTVVDQYGMPAEWSRGTIYFLHAGEELGFRSFQTDSAGGGRMVWSRADGEPDSVEAYAFGSECGRYAYGPMKVAVPVEPQTERHAFRLSVFRALLAPVDTGTSCASGPAWIGDFWLYLHVDSLINQGPLERIYGVWRITYTVTRRDDLGPFVGTLALGDLVLDLDGGTNYDCDVRFRLVARGVSDRVIGPAALETVTPCSPAFPDSFQLVKTEPLPWFP